MVTAVAHPVHGQTLGQHMAFPFRGDRQRVGFQPGTGSLDGRSKQPLASTWATIGSITASSQPLMAFRPAGRLRRDQINHSKPQAVIIKVSPPRVIWGNQPIRAHSMTPATWGSR